MEMNGTVIRAVPEQHSSPEVHPANKSKMHLKQKKKKKKRNSNSLEYEDVLYFDQQPHPMAFTIMEWKQTLQGSYS